MRAGPVHNQYARLPWLIAAMTAAALAIGIIAARYVEGRLVASKGETLALAASEVAHKLDLVLAEQYDDTLELSRASVFHKRDASEQSAYLSAVKRLHSNFLWLGAADARGRIVASTDPAAIGKALSDRALFQTARDTGRVQVGDVQPFVEAGGIDAVSFAVPITSPRGSFHGVVATHVGLPHLEQVIARTIEAVQARQELKEVIEYRFATVRGDVFVDSEPLHENHANLEQLGLLSARQSKSGQPGYIEEEHPHRHDRIITGYALTQGAGKFPGLKWTVLLHADRDAMVAPIWNMLRKLAAAWALVWLPMLGFSLWSARRLKQAWAQVQEERAHAETAESKYRDLVEKAEDIIYQVDLHGYFTYINPAVTRYKGYTQYELIGRHFTEHIRPDAREAARRYYLRQFARKTPSTYYEFPVIKKDGGEIWFGQNVRLLIENDRPVGFLAVARDITERKRAEEQLRKNEERLQIVIRATNDVIWDWDLNTDAVQWSQGIHTLFGYKAEDIEPGAQSWYSRLHTDDRERVMTDLHAAIDRGEQYWSDEYRFRRADGSDAYVFDRGYVLRDNAGKAVRMIGAMQDVTERKQAEERFAKINECFLNFGVNSEININNLTALCGELLGAACALYNYLDGPLLRSIGKWNAPPGFNPVDPAVGHICHDVIQEGADHPVTVHDLPETRYAQTDPNVLPYKLKTYFGMAVKCRDTAVGSLCAVFQRDYVPSEADAKLLGIIAAAIGVEEERRRGEEALRESEKRFRTIFDQAPLGIAVIESTSGRFRRINKTYCDIVAYSNEELLARTFMDITHPDDLQADMDNMTHLMEGQTTGFKMEKRYIRKDNSIVWVNLTCVPLWLEEKKERRFHIAMVEDITERKHAEEKLLLSREIIANAHDPISIMDLEGRFTYQNPAHASLVGFSDDELLGKTPALFLGDDAFASICQDLGRTQSYRGEVALRTKQGAPKDLDLSVFAIRDAAAKPICFVAIKRDVTERKRAEKVRERLLEELAESRNRFEMFFRQTPSAIAITTIKEGRFLDLNKQAEILTGYTREELIGRTTLEMNLYVIPADRPKFVERIKESGLLNEVEREIRTKSGEIRTAVFSLVPVQMGSEPCLLSIAHDITERKQAEQRLHERSRQQAIEAELGVLAVTIQDLPHLLRTAAGLVSNALEVNYCEVLELVRNGTDLRLCASAGWRGDDIGQVRALETGSPAHAALNSNKPVIRTLPKESRFGGPKWLHEHGTVSAMSVSIPGKDDPWGVLGVYTTLTRAFSRDDVNFLQTVSSILATAIERMQAESVLRSANQALRLLSRQLLQVQEDDRRAIARDLHDEIGQSLTAIKLNVERAQRTADRDLRTHIMRDCAQITEQVLGQVRNLSLDLHPSILDDLGLAYALKWYADRQAERAGLKVELTADPSLPRLPQDIEISCFRIAQEALTNVVRHARADLASITLKRGGSSVELCIQDDGVGFVVDQASAQTNGRSSVGLASMQERAKLLGGTVKITSAPNCGTTVVATLPLPVASPAGMTTEQAGRS